MHRFWAAWLVRGMAAGVLVGVLALFSASRAVARTDSVARTGPMLPAEFEPVSQLFVTWPDDEELAEFVGELVAEAASAANVVIAVNSVVDRRDIEDVLWAKGADPLAVRYVYVDYTSMWVRDFGPLRVRTATGHSIVEFEYFGERNDDRMADAMADKLWSTNSVELPIEFEGGNLLSNGAGTCLTTEQLLETNRAFTEAQMREMFRASFGCRRLIILPKLDREGTGHIDMYAALVSSHKVLVGRYESDEDQINARRLDRAANTLKRAGFEVVRIPMGANEDGVFRTYTNITAVNDVVLVPVYPASREHEQEAIGILKTAYPGRRVAPIDATGAIELGGAIHCVTLTVAL